ncbi:LysM peptidoglycan-binding domain-containing protein [Neobacillus terrae]|uniref:LysM peptidoglycan-binding domain-containing protein n=1 Tax=Neobacillus terrae TaxID=3034837 RepID=UPI001408D0A5|nr:LysM peptidoglycan-binding domain-containing protein [Neobacillus terrae]NHM29089.1 LysM peptidoglycan-binding domain-containing protein [Neobacillus terrae]
MSKEDPYRDQAERLRQRIEKINVKPAAKETLPPREELHRSKKKKTKWKIKYPVIRLLVLFFILLPVTIFSAYSYINGKDFSVHRKVSGGEGGYDTVSIEKYKAEKSSSNKEKPAESQKADEPKVNVAENNKILTIPNSPPDLSGTKDTDKNSTPVEAPGKKQPVQKIAAVPPAEKKQETPQTPQPIGKVVYHTVQPKETIFRIAMKYYNSQAGINTIKEANHIQNNEIETGQVLKIPLNN